ncbi:membrane protein [Alkaliphilus serpentinus]|uniref:Membrane protein n=2 Tax=Alkaliphilus serpentinus TaxID=1482731 RepID=A0A833HP16_9FIRM|nr:membrane protein [Alkaliphilus serpentinus]
MKKLPSLFFGLLLYSFGVLLMRDAGLGMNPWGVFHMGVTNHTPLTLGQVTQITGLVILTVSTLLKIVPGLGSICNMLFIGFFVDSIDRLNILATPTSLAGKLLMLVMGVLITGWATYFYLRVRLGAGPRDGLMEGLVKATGKPVWLIRGIIEFVILIVGFFLGGPVGIGTLITATTIGFSVAIAFKIGKYDTKGGVHTNCLQLYKQLKATPSMKEQIQ